MMIIFTIVLDSERWELLFLLLLHTVLKTSIDFENNAAILFRLDTKLPNYSKLQKQTFHKHNYTNLNIITI